MTDADRAKGIQEYCSKTINPSKLKIKFIENNFECIEQFNQQMR